MAMKAKPRKAENEKEDLHTYTTDDGIEVELTAVSHVLMSEIPMLVEEEYREMEMPVDPPTYTTTIAGGTTEEQPHDETTLEYPLEKALEDADNDPDKAREIQKRETAEAVRAWTKHQNCVLEMASVANTRQRDYMLRRGVKQWSGGREIPQAWIDEVRLDGFHVPEEGPELELYWILRGLLKTANDQAETMFRIMALTSKGIKNSQVEGALEFFRDQMAGLNTPVEVEPAAAEELLDDESKGGAG